MSTAPDLLKEQLRGTFIARQVRRSNRRLFAVNAALVIAIAALTIANSRYLNNFVRGPLAMSGDQLAAISNPDSLARYFVSVNGQKSIPSGIQHIEQEVDQTTNKVQSEKVDVDYLILVVDKRLLIVKASPGSTATQFTGAVVGLPGDVRSEVVGQVHDPDLAGQFVPLMLDATGFRVGGYWGIAICLPVLLLAVWNLRQLYRRVQTPALHPIIASLSRYGAVPATAMEIEDDLRGQTESLGNATISRSWIFVNRTFGLSICRISEIVWAYKERMKQSYATIIFRRDGTRLQVDGKQQKMHRLLQLIASRAPWALIGFNMEIDRRRRANWQAFVSEVESRRTKAAGA